MAAEFRWYCLRAMTGKELKVKAVIDAEIAKSDLGKNVSEVIVPTEKVISTVGGKKVEKEKVLFSGYVFVRCRLVGDVQSQLSQISNVVNFLMGRVSKKPEPLPDEQIEAMLGHVDEGLKIAEARLTFVAGEQVKVNDGPFKDFDGVVEDVNNEKKKLKVMVKIFGRKTPLELNFDEVDKQS